MKKIVLITQIAILLFISHNIFAGDMDLVLRQIVSAPDANLAAPWGKNRVSRDGTTLIPCLLKSADPERTMAAIKSAGGSVSQISSDLLSAELPIGSIAEIVNADDVIFAEAATPLSKKMDTARTAGYVDIVQDGSALGTAYDGTNVVVGVVDDGLDYGHPDFLNSESITRVQYIMQKDGTTNIECTKRTIHSGDCEITDEGQGTYHGTHVTGMAAGGNSVYTGAAPKADIMFVFAAPSDPDTSGSFATVVLEGVSKIFEKADTMNKAAVANLSLGTSMGAHDGTSLLEQGLTSLSTAKVGRIIVNAAGNEQVVSADFPSGDRDYVGGIHASINLAASENKAARLAVWSGSASASSDSGGTVIDIWLDANQKDNCSIAVLGYTTGRSSKDYTFAGLTSTTSASLYTSDIPFATDSTTTANGGSVEASISVAATDARNSKSHAMVTLTPYGDGTSATVLESMWFDIVIRSTAAGTCTGNMWLYYDYTAYHDFLKGIAVGTYDVGAGDKGAAYKLADGDSFYTTTIPATASGVIAAGSWMPEKPIGTGTSKWTADNGTTYDQSDIAAPGGTGSTTNDLSGFSSLGPTADGRTKPEICGPGEPIIAAKARGTSISSSLTVGGSHFKEAGTSMSSPYITGVVALLLQRNNTLGVDAVKTALAVGASTSGMTSRTTDAKNTYGAGKVNAAEVLKSVSPDTSAYSGTGDLDPITGSSSSCTLNKYSKGGIFVVAIALIPFLLLYWKRRRLKLKSILVRRNNRSHI